MKSEPLVSVVIPTYKRPEKLVQCINSVLQQTYSNIEIIVVDDNNPDTVYRKRTEQEMSQFATDSRVVYLKHDANKKGSAARNTGWRKSSGTYITFIDDDDEIAKEKISRQVSCLDNLDETWGACYTAYLSIKPNGTEYLSSEKRSGNRYIDALMRTMFMGSGSNLMLRKSVVDEINGYDESFIRYQDIEFLTRVLEKYKLAYVDEVLLTIHQESAEKRWTFEEYDGFAQYYVERFTDRINRLSTEDKERVLAVISLDRCRVAIGYHKPIKGVCIIVQNRVKFKYVWRYLLYLSHRVITKESYGFDGL